jgi:hypothetical protein
MPVAGRGLGLDVHQRDAIDEEQHIRADAVVSAILILPRFCGRPDKRETADRMPP